MKVSVVIPVSRIDEALQCLESFEIQTFANSEFEVVAVSVLDLAPLEAFPASFRLTCLRAERNHPSIMRNLGVANTSGGIIGFVDDDTVVPPNWVADAHRILVEDGGRIIGGPNVDRRSPFRFALANAAQEHPFLEGLKNHRAMAVDHSRVGAHDLPLSNAAMRRETFERVGGFNEVANYYMDGSEFLYIATRLGIPIYLYRDLEIQHNVRPALLPYLRYKWRARRMLGANYVLFPECYRGTKPIRLIFASFLILPPAAALLWASGQPATWLAAAGLGYLGVLYAGGIRFLRHPAVFAASAPTVFLAQAASYLGFVAGLIQGLATKSRNQDVIAHKRLRYRVFEERSA